MEPVEKKFLLQVPSSTQNLALVRDFVNSVGLQAGLDERAVNQLQLAVDEACANVIEHAYGNDSTKEVLLCANFDDESLEIRVEDTGKGFDPHEGPAESLETLIAKRKRGGLGLKIMQKVMDEVHYDIEPGQRNMLRMVKKLKKSDSRHPPKS